MNFSTLLCLAALLFSNSTGTAQQKSSWSWECVQGYGCQKKRITDETRATAISLPVCRLVCSQYAALWPKPRGDFSIGNYLAKVNFNSIDVLEARGTSDLVRSAGTVFKEGIQSLIPRGVTPSGGKSLVITLDIQDSSVTRPTLETDESYTLKVNESSDGRLQALIAAPTFFGARHGLETLGQLIVFDDFRDELQMPRDVLVTDSPAYPHRGIMLDTSRNFITVDSIKKVLKGMGASKLNTFHWHIIDSHSFPFYSKSRPNLSRLGAYSPSKVYNPEDVREIVEYARVRGVRVVPEFDAPAHVGEGWQDTGLVTCLNWQPWDKYCVEPPCGQFDVTKDELYDYLEDIYGDMLELFQPDVFHMGGDEVMFSCWNSTSNIVQWMANRTWGTTDADFVKLWNHFQGQALERLYKKAGRQIPAVMWSSTLTWLEYLLASLPKEQYIIQVWAGADQERATQLLANGYKIILSNYDVLYLDCGFGGWVQGGNNWCSPYIGWQKIYNNTPASIAGDKKNLILGMEAALWTEQADAASIDSRIWPRAAAMAEVLWSEPITGWEMAEQRFLIHRERLVTAGIDADVLQPEWCWQNEENCRIGSKFHQKPSTGGS